MSVGSADLKSIQNTHVCCRRCELVTRDLYRKCVLNMPTRLRFAYELATELLTLAYVREQTIA